MRHAKEENNSGDSFGWRDTLVWCGIPIIIVLLIRIFLLGFYVIPSGSMMNTIEPGDRVITSKLTPKVFDLKRGDVVVFKDPDHWLRQEDSSKLGGDYLIKRLIGLPGDTVACEGPGKPITINGVAIDESAYIRPDVDPSSFAFNVTVTEGHVFVMGDNRANSADSRYHQGDSSHGLVPISDVVGVGLAKYWPLNRIGGLDAHHEVFADVPEGGSQESSHLEVPKGVADSKMLTEHKREAIFDELKSWCASWAVGAASNKEIDEWGISHALGVAALRALAQAEAKLGIDGNGMLSGKPVKVGAILDGPNDYITKTLNTFDAPEVPVPANVTTKVKGDRYCAAVAAAAVIAKVTRDRLMVELGAQPQYEPYEWAHNKGYGSAAHRDAIAEFGPSDLHRLSWHLV